MIDLIQGDCLDAMKDMPDNSIDAIVADPPYNLVGKIDEIHLFRQSEVRGNKSHTKESMDYDINFNQFEWLDIAVKKLKKGGHFIIFNDWENMGDIAKYLKVKKIKVKSLNHWQKTNPLPSEWRRRFVPGREHFLHAVKPGKYSFNTESIHHGDFVMGLTPKREKSNGSHPNQKPLKLMEEIISIITNDGDVILDPFMGSGTTGVACVNLNRNFIGIELDKEYFKLAENRIKQATG